jgi:peptidoglycan/LPS O-acetylase OafA/YrhL
MVHHFTYANPKVTALFPGFTGLFRYSSFGVWMFFVISGFVIPYAMYSINHRISDDAWPFLLRRIVRLEPAYIASVFVAFALTFAATRTPGYGGPPVPSLGGFCCNFFIYAGGLTYPGSSILHGRCQSNSSFICSC